MSRALKKREQRRSKREDLNIGSQLCQIDLDLPTLGDTEFSSGCGAQELVGLPMKPASCKD